MKTLTLSADEAVLNPGRRRAAAENRTLDDSIREWLEQQASHPCAADPYESLMQRLSHISAGERFSREDLRERRRRDGFT